MTLLFVIIFLDKTFHNIKIDVKIIKILVTKTLK